VGKPINLDDGGVEWKSNDVGACVSFQRALRFFTLSNFFKISSEETLPRNFASSLGSVAIRQEHEASREGTSQSAADTPVRTFSSNEFAWGALTKEYPNGARYMVVCWYDDPSW